MSNNILNENLFSNKEVKFILRATIYIGEESTAGTSTAVEKRTHIKGGQCMPMRFRANS